MDLAEIRRLVEQGEGTALEFKKSTGELREAMAALCGMLDAAGGGKVVFGVTDDGAVVGQDFAERTLEDIANESRKLEPKAEVTTTRRGLPGTGVRGGGPVVRRPVLATGRTARRVGDFLRRAGSGCTQRKLRKTVSVAASSRRSKNRRAG